MSHLKFCSSSIKDSRTSSVLKVLVFYVHMLSCVCPLLWHSSVTQVPLGFDCVSSWRLTSYVTSGQSAIIRSLMFAPFMALDITTSSFLSLWLLEDTDALVGRVVSRGWFGLPHPYGAFRFSFCIGRHLVFCVATHVRRTIIRNAQSYCGRLLPSSAFGRRRPMHSDEVWMHH